LKRKQLGAHTVGIKVKLSDRSVFGRQTSFIEPVEDADIISDAAVHCLKRMALGQPVRLIGVRVTNLVALGVRQISLFGGSHSHG
jgi:hypothetical protein